LLFSTETEKVFYILYTLLPPLSVISYPLPTIVTIKYLKMPAEPPAPTPPPNVVGVGDQGSANVRTILTSVDFRFSGNSTRKNSAVFVPHKVSAKQLSSIIADVWQMPAPNMLISVDAGSAHPSELATKDLCLSSVYRNWAQQGREQTAQTEGERAK